MTQRKILLTGAAGVVGSALLRHLDGQPVAVLAHRKPVPHPSLVGDITRPWLGLSPADYRALAAEVEVVIHCAASVNFGAAPRTLHDINVRGTGQVLQFVADARARLVHVSTAFIASIAAESTAAGQEPIIKAYALSKQKGESMVRESGLPATIARVSTVIGDSMTGEIARLQAFQYVLGASMQGLLPFIPHLPETRVDLVPQDTVAAALLALASADSERGEYWITAGPAALPLPRIIDIGFEVALERLRRDPSAPKLYYEAFRPRLVEPETYDRVMEMVFAQARAETKLGTILPQLAGLMASYSPSVAFPTSLGQIAGGPPAPTEQVIERAVRSTCIHLSSLPKDVWSYI